MKNCRSESQSVGCVVSTLTAAGSDSGSGCAQGEGVIKVEVKGTTTDGAKVGLTHKEVNLHVHGYPDNALAFVWTKTAEQILQSIQRLMKRINGAGHSST